MALAACGATIAGGWPQEALAGSPPVSGTRTDTSTLTVGPGTSTLPGPGARTGPAVSRAPAARTTTPAPPPLGVRAAALIEESSGQELYGRNSSAELAIASTTKLMTALVTLEHTRLSQVFADPNYYPAAEDSQIGLEPGERMSVHDLLTAMLLPSADDAAEDLAYNVGHGSVSRFLGMMNARAAPARADAHALHDPDRARHARQLLERGRSGRSGPLPALRRAVLQGAWCERRTRCCGPETTSAS